MTLSLPSNKYALANFYGSAKFAENCTDLFVSLLALVTTRTASPFCAFWSKHWICQYDCASTQVQSMLQHAGDGQVNQASVTDSVRFSNPTSLSHFGRGRLTTSPDLETLRGSMPLHVSGPRLSPPWWGVDSSSYHTCPFHYTHGLSYYPLHRGRVGATSNLDSGTSSSIEPH